MPKFTLYATQELLASNVKSAGTVIVGKEISVTFTVCIAVETFPLASVTVHVTEVVPVGKPPIGALFVTLAIVQLSVIVGGTKVCELTQLVAFRFTVNGATITGAVTSTTVIT